MSCGLQMIWDIEITSSGGPMVGKGRKIRPYIFVGQSPYCPPPECRGVVDNRMPRSRAQKISSAVDSGRDVIILRHDTTCLG